MNTLIENVAKSLTFFCCIILLTNTYANAQCGTNTQSGNFCTNVVGQGNWYKGAFSAANGSNWFDITNYGPGQAFIFYTLPNACYSVSTCGAPVPTDITVKDTWNDPSPIAWNNANGPLCSGTQASVNFKNPLFNSYVDIRQVNCGVNGSASIVVQIRQNNNLNFTSSDAPMCEGDSRNLTATPIYNGSVNSSQYGSPGTFTGPGVNGNVFTAPTPVGDSQVIAITYTYGFVNTQQNITVYHTPSVSNAGFDQSMACTQTSTTLSANTPTYGVGHWSIVSGYGEFTDSLDPNTTITNLSPGNTTVVRWNITNGPCTPNTSDLTIYYIDNVAPTAPVLGPDTIDCAGFINPPIATDNCLDSVIGTTNATPNFVEGDSIFVTWTFEDNNNNSSTATQWVYYYDKIAPDAPALSDMYIDCNDTLPIITTSDACAGTVTGTTNDVLNFVDGDSTLITWNFDDGNGNITSVGQWYYYDDTIAAPAPLSLSDDTVRCDLALNPPKVLDNCADTVTAFTSDTINFSIGGSQIITWIFDDGNGNFSTVDQNLIYIDDEPPVVGILTSVPVDCNGTLNPPVALDGCAGNITGTTNDVLNYVEGDSILITWTFDDGNGNSTTAGQYYVYDDTTGPIAPVVPSTTVDCNGVLTAPPTTTDNCAPGTITGTTTGSLNFVEGDSTIIVWSFDDGNGNVSTSNQVYYYDDVNAPATPTLSNVIVDCNAGLTAPTTTDDCAGTVTGTTNDVLNFVQGDSTLITWTFDDGNGNSTTATQYYVYDDPIAPTVPTLANITIDCNGTLGTPTTTDNCPGLITGTTNDVLNYVESDSTLITWTFDDGNGNSVTATQWYFYEDNSAPVPDSTSLSDVIAICEVNNLVSPTATDNCASTVTVTNDANLPITTIGTTVVTWTYDDGNGNQIMQTQNVIVSDLNATVTLNPPATLTADQSGDTYQWIDCSDNSPISGATSQTFTATSSGDYAVIVTVGVCRDTSDCTNVTLVGLNSSVARSNIRVFPNPAHRGQFKISSDSEIIKVEMYNILGRLLSDQVLIDENNNVNASALESAEYILKIYTEDGVEIRKVIINQ